MIRYDTPTLADGPELDAMALASWNDTFAHLYPQADLDAFVGEAFGETGWLRRDLADPRMRWQAARAGNDIVGYAKMSPPWLEQASADDAQLSQLYIARDWHGKGIAQALMDWVFATARAADAPALLLTVFEDNHRAIAFYAKYGFVHVGDYDFPVGQTIDRDLVMRLAL